MVLTLNHPVVKKLKGFPYGHGALQVNPEREHTYIEYECEPFQTDLSNQPTETESDSSIESRHETTYPGDPGVITALG